MQKNRKLPKLESVFDRLQREGGVGPTRMVSSRQSRRAYEEINREMRLFRQELAVKFHRSARELEHIVLNA